MAPGVGLSEKLLELRRNIDQIDDELMRLLLKRQSFVHQVGELKKAAGDTGSFIRPDREAAMIRSMVKRFTGTEFHPAAAAQLWRIMIGAALTHESPLALSVSRHAPQTLTLAREYFGNFIPATVQEKPDAVLADCLKSPHTIGVFSEKEKDWWGNALTRNPQLKIFAKLPFVAIPHDPVSEAVYMIGQVTPADTGEDESIFFNGGWTIKPGFHATEKQCIGAYAVPVKVTL